MAKNLYHSLLVKMGPVHAEITTDVQPSKFKGKGDWCGLKINGEEFSYTVENAACAETLQGRKGSKVMLEATGGRDDAQIVISAATRSSTQSAPGEDAPPAQPPPQQRQQRTQSAAPQQQPPPQQAPASSHNPEDQQRLAMARKQACKLSNLYMLCFAAADHSMSEICQQRKIFFDLKDSQTEQTHKLATTFFIAMSGTRNGNFEDNMGTGILDITPKQ